MGTRYLTDLADVARRTGFAVVEVGAGPSQTGNNWQYRARNSGGYDGGKPNHLMVHHTASGPSSDGWRDVNYCTFASSSRPVANLYISRRGEIFVMAGGATNTNGLGVDPCGVTVANNMNRDAIGIEAGNGGTGEAWPEVQQDCYVRLCYELQKHYGITRLHSHFEYAPQRKVDPAGESSYATGAATWNMDAFRDDVRNGGPKPQPEPPLPTMEDDDMKHVIAPDRGAALVGPGYWHFAHSDNEAFVMRKVYGPPQVLDNAYDYDLLMKMAALNPDDDSQLGET